MKKGERLERNVVSARMQLDKLKFSIKDIAPSISNLNYIALPSETPATKRRYCLSEASKSALFKLKEFRKPPDLRLPKHTQTPKERSYLHVSALWSHRLRDDISKNIGRRTKRGEQDFIEKFRTKFVRQLILDDC